MIGKKETRRSPKAISLAFKLFLDQPVDDAAGHDGPDYDRSRNRLQLTKLVHLAVGNPDCYRVFVRNNVYSYQECYEEQDIFEVFHDECVLWSAVFSCLP